MCWRARGNCFAKSGVKFRMALGLRVIKFNLIERSRGACELCWRGSTSSVTSACVMETWLALATAEVVMPLELNFFRNFDNLPWLGSSSARIRPSNKYQCLCWNVDNWFGELYKMYQYSIWNALIDFALWCKHKDVKKKKNSFFLMN